MSAKRKRTPSPRAKGKRAPGGSTPRNAPGPRRTQAERTAETTGRLIQATIDCLVEVGYHGTTTGAVCKRAGVSHGSLLHHYGTRQRLLAAALDSAYESLRGSVVRSLEERPPDTERIEALVELMWKGFEAPEFKAVIELWLAAANEPDVGWTIWPEAQAFDRAIQPLAAQLFPELADRVTEFPLYISLIFQTLQGMGLARATWPDDADDGTRHKVRALLAGLIRDSIREKYGGQSR